MHRQLPADSGLVIRQPEIEQIIAEHVQRVFRTAYQRISNNRPAIFIGADRSHKARRNGGQETRR